MIEMKQTLVEDEHIIPTCPSGMCCRVGLARLIFKKSLAKSTISEKFSLFLVRVVLSCMNLRLEIRARCSSGDSEGTPAPEPFRDKFKIRVLSSPNSNPPGSANQ